jgi:hypothetical protein
MYGGYAPNGEEFANTQPGDGGDLGVEVADCQLA